jgi:hypothetical protein
MNRFSDRFFRLVAGCLLTLSTLCVSPARAQGGSVQTGNAVVQVQLGPGGAATAKTVATGSPVISGYATANATAGDTPYGTAIISVVQNNNIVSEVGVPPSTMSLSNRVYTARIFIDYRSGVPSYVKGAGPVDVNTGIALASPGGGSANVTLTLRDAFGNILSSGQGVLADGAHIARFIDQMSDIAPNFALPANFSTTAGFGSLEITSNRALSVVALRMTMNQRGEILYTTTPGAPFGRSSANALYLPQMVDGGGYKMTLTLMNTASAPQSGTVQLFGDDGSAFSIRPAKGSPATSFRYNIPAGGLYVLESDGSPASSTAFSAQVIPDAGNALPEGAGIYSFTQNGILVTESGVPSSSLTTHARIFVDTTGGHNTGLALANPSGSAVNITLRAFQSDGTTQVGDGPAGVTLAGNGHSAFFTGQMVSGLPANFTGVLDISASVPFSALTVRSLTNARGDFLLTTFPTADLTQRAPSLPLFAQIAEGGGYSTQIVFLSDGIPSNVTLRYLDNAGTPLPIGAVQ